jgi:SAM-dependent methyltransferase
MNWYDFPQYYDIAFGWDAADELDFLERMFAAHADGPVKAIFEPFCGTGRLAIPLAGRGYRVIGCDLNPRAIAFARTRSEAEGLLLELAIGDVREWLPPQPVDAIVTLIDSFRHLQSERDVAGTFATWRRGLRDGGVLVLGLCLGLDATDAHDAKPWVMERGGVRVETTVGPVPKPVRVAGNSILRHAMRVTERDGRTFEIATDEEMRSHTWESLTTEAFCHGEFEASALYAWSDLKTPIDINAPIVSPKGNHVAVLRPRRKSR